MLFLTQYHNLIYQEKWTDKSILGEKESVLTAHVQNSYSVVKNPNPKQTDKTSCMGVYTLSWN